MTTPGPWKWVIHDYSMASLEGPNWELDNVLSVTPCNSCREGAKKLNQDWQWGRCYTPSKANADLLAKAPELRDSLEGLVADLLIMGEKWEIHKCVGVVARLQVAQELLNQLKQP